MKMLPGSLSGKWAVWLAGSFITVFAVSIVLSQANVYIGTAGQVLGLGIGAAGTAALIVGFVSVLRNGERSLLVYLSLVVGLYALMFFILVVWLTLFGGELFHLNF